jgi:D-alanyl-D-alanine carboxypeptidase
MAVLLSYVYEESKPLFEKTAQDSFVAVAESGMKHTALNTDILAAKIPWLRAGKTGLTPRVGGSLVVLIEPRGGQKLVACVLGSTEKERFTDIETLITTVLSQTN